MVIQKEVKKMSSPNEIASLQKIMVKPMSWRVLQSPDGSYTLQFTYLPSIKAQYAEVLTRRGDIKTYQHMTSVMNDIKRVQQDGMINFHFN